MLVLRLGHQLAYRHGLSNRAQELDQDEADSESNVDSMTFLTVSPSAVTNETMASTSTVRAPATRTSPARMCASRQGKGGNWRSDEDAPQNVVGGGS